MIPGTRLVLSRARLFIKAARCQGLASGSLPAAPIRTFVLGGVGIRPPPPIAGKRFAALASKRCSVAARGVGRFDAQPFGERSDAAPDGEGRRAEGDPTEHERANGGDRRPGACDGLAECRSDSTTRETDSQAGVGLHFYKADIGRRLKMKGDTRLRPRITIR